MKTIHLGLMLVATVLILTFSGCRKASTGLTLISPASNSTNIANGQTFTCSTVSGALTYTFYFNGSRAGQTNQSSAVSSTIVNFLLPGDTYTWYVQANMQDGSVQTSQTWSFTASSNNSGGAINLQQPSYAATGVCTTPTFTWTGAVSASYDIVIANDGNFSSIVQTTTVTGTSYTIPVSFLGTSTSYYWRVAPTGTSNYSSDSYFYTVGPPAMRSPQDGSTASSTSVAFTWSPVLCASSYSIQLSIYSDFHTIATEQTFSATSCTLNQLSSSTHYYWRVKVAGDPYYSSTLYGNFYTP